MPPSWFDSLLAAVEYMLSASVLQAMLRSRRVFSKRSVYYPSLIRLFSFYNSQGCSRREQTNFRCLERRGRRRLRSNWLERCVLISVKSYPFSNLVSLFSSTHRPECESLIPCPRWWSVSMRLFRRVIRNSRRRCGSTRACSGSMLLFAVSMMLLLPPIPCVSRRLFRRVIRSSRSLCGSTAAVVSWWSLVLVLLLFPSFGRARVFGGSAQPASKTGWSVCTSSFPVVDAMKKVPKAKDERTTSMPVLGLREDPLTNPSFFAHWAPVYSTTPLHRPRPPPIIP
mmetsp:Transcript_105930/g.215987  ORF Transcript_105930/g.215987 Transcript_105930/m.215987 type:complete len:283 (-) Transcript_105930:387-1235(-)